MNVNELVKKLGVKGHFGCHMSVSVNCIYRNEHKHQRNLIALTNFPFCITQMFIKSQKLIKLSHMGLNF